MTRFLELKKQSNLMAKPLHTNPSSFKEVDDDMTEPTASLEHTPNVPYEMRTEGPLTYFHYYFEEVNVTIDDETEAVQNNLTKFLANRYLVGAGVLAATAISGLAIADVNKAQVSAKPNAPEPAVQQNSPKATDATKPLKLMGAKVQPLQTNQPLWSNQSSLNVGTTPNAKLTASAATPEPGLKDASQKRLVIDRSNASSTLSEPLRFSLPSLPKTTGRMSVVQKAEPVARLKQTGTQPKPDVAPTPQPVKPQPLPNTTLQTEKGVPASQVAGIASPETLAPQAAGESIRAQAPASLPTQTVLPLPSLPTQPAAQDNERPATSTSEQAKRSEQAIRGLEEASSRTLSEENATKESVGALNANKTTPQNIQDFLDRSHPLPTGKAVTIVPLTQKAAEDVLAMNKVGLSTDKAGRFLILHLSLQDYQQAWLARNKAAQQLALVGAFPTYGFVDYQDRIIAVLDQKQPLQTNHQAGLLIPEA